MSIKLAIKLCRSRPLIKPHGGNSISRFVSVLTDGNLLFVGENSYKSHPLMLRYSRYPHIHAEVDAVRQALSYYTKVSGRRRDDYRGIRLNNFKLFTARCLSDGSVGLAKPCIACTNCISEFGVKIVEYTR